MRSTGSEVTLVDESGAELALSLCQCTKVEDEDAQQDYREVEAFHADSERVS